MAVNVQPELRDVPGLRCVHCGVSRAGVHSDVEFLELAALAVADFNSDADSTQECCSCVAVGLSLEAFIVA